MSRIGIMTWYYGANYGALAQSIALYNAIKNQGYDCVFINYKPKNYLKTLRYANLPKRRELYKLNRVINGIKKIKNLSTTKYFSVTSKVKSADDINSLGLDKIVFGSDAIFNIKHAMCDPLFYGVGITSPKVTYSPSCEYLDPEYNLPDEYKHSLCEMDNISVRDVNTYNLVERNTGIKPQITLDPTFLYDFSGIGESVCKDKYMLMYSFSAWNEYSQEVTAYAKRNNLKIVCLGQKVNWADISIENATFEQWVEAFRKANIVMTDSFHGTIFSLKNNKQIILCGRNDKLSKINSLLAQLGASIEIYNGRMIEDYLSHNIIDYDKTNGLMASEVDRSLNYLVNALK